MTTCNSFAETANALGFNIKAKAAKTPKDKKCFKCGGTLHLVPGTNVYACDGTIDVYDKQDKTKVIGQRPCPSFLTI